MNKKTKEELRTFLKDLFSKSNVVEYSLADFIDDGDINFIISPNTGRHKIKNDFKLMLLVYCSDMKSLTMYCPLVYRLNEEDSIMFTLNAINNTNNKISLGKIYLNDDNGSISYINKILFDNMINDLTTDMMNEYIESFLFCSLELYNQMKKGNENGWKK